MSGSSFLKNGKSMKCSPMFLEKEGGQTPSDVSPGGVLISM